MKKSFMSSNQKQTSFLPAPPIKAKMPSPNTLAARALQMLLDGKQISHPDFEDATDSWRLAAPIHDLNKLGWPVETVDIEFSASKKPKTRYIRKYFFTDDFIRNMKSINSMET